MLTRFSVFAVAISCILYFFVAFVGKMLQVDQIVFSKDIVANDYFGGALDVSGDTAVVTSLNATVEREGAKRPAKKAGAAYVFEKRNNRWIGYQKLVANDPEVNGNLGFSVSIDQDTIALGAWRTNVNNVRNTGAVYIFSRLGDIWSQTARITPPELIENGQFGVSVAVQQGRLVVGYQRWSTDEYKNIGAAYVYQREGSDWVLEASLFPSPMDDELFFGRSVSITEGRIAVGAPSIVNEEIAKEGSVYVFRYDDNGSWAQESKIEGTDSSTDLFGGIVAIDHQNLAVGAWNYDAQYTNSGKVFMYRYDEPSSWAPDGEISPSTLMSNDKFGIFLSLSNNKLVVGAHLTDVASLKDRGLAYLYKRNASGWGLLTEINPSRPKRDMHFGRSVAVDGDTVAVGAEFSPLKGKKAGAAHFYSVHDLSSRTYE